MALTVLQVLQTALDQAQLDQSSTFLAKARLYYNMVLANQGRNFDWPFYNKLNPDQNFLPGVTSYAVPADYQRSDSCFLINTANANQQSAQIMIVEQYRFDLLKTPTLNGIPTRAYIDQNNGLIVFESSPASATYSWRLRYFREPTLIDLGGANDSSTPDFPDEMALIKDITAWLMDYTDDERAPMKKQEVDKQYGSFKQK